MYRNLSGPLSVQVEITESCPNQCVHCYNYWRHQAGQVDAAAVMRPDLVDRLMDEIERAKVFEIIITGGEPLRNKRAMYRMLDRIEHSPLLHGSLNTTLIGLTEDDAKRLANYRHLVSVLVSVMGPTAEIHDQVADQAGAFEQTIEGIKRLRRAGVAVSTNMVVSQLNRAYIGETAAFCKRLGAKMFNATRAVSPMNCADFSPYSLGLSEFRSYLTDLGNAGREQNIPVGVLTIYPLCAVKEVDRHPMTYNRRCSAGVTVAALSATGEMRSCTHVQDSVGNIRDTSLPELWARLQPWRDGSLIPASCKSCRALPLCGGGCRAGALVVNGSLKAEDPLMQADDVETAIASHYREQRNRAPNVVVPATLRLNPELRWRREPLGSIWFLRQCVGIFDPATSDFLEELIGRSVHQAELAAVTNPSFLTGLVEKQILIAGEDQVSDRPVPMPTS